MTKEIKDNRPLKVRYQEHRQKIRDCIKEIEQHDPKMAESARKLLGIPKEDE